MQRCCSQPLLGTGNRRCRVDEKLLNACLGKAGRGYILDLRSLQPAQQSRTKGGGLELDSHSPRWKRMHHGLQSFSILQESVTKLTEATHDMTYSMEKWLSKLESSGWLNHVKETLALACLAAQCIDKDGWSVLVHGTEGRDDTLQVTSLTQIILNPECRTMKGFILLIEREWLHAGYPFMSRSIQATGRFTYKINSKTASLWSYLLSGNASDKFINPLYKRRNAVIWPSVAPQSIDVWEELYIPNSFPDTILARFIQKLSNERRELQSRNHRLSEKVKEFQESINSSDLKDINFEPASNNEVPNHFHLEPDSDAKPDVSLVNITPNNSSKNLLPAPLSPTITSINVGADSNGKTAIFATVSFKKSVS